MRAPGAPPDPGAPTDLGHEVTARARGGTGAVGGAVEIRMAFQTMSFVVMPYVLLCDAELEQIVGVGGEAGRQLVEDHVVRAGLRLIFVG